MIATTGVGDEFQMRLQDNGVEELDAAVILEVERGEMSRD